MDGIGILIFGVLIVVAVLTITSAIIAFAPYLAGGVVIVGLFWFYIRYSNEDDPPPDLPPMVKPKPNPRE